MGPPRRPCVSTFTFSIAARIFAASAGQPPPFSTASRTSPPTHPSVICSARQRPIPFFSSSPICFLMGRSGPQSQRFRKNEYPPPHVEFPILEARQFALGLDVRPGDVVAVPTQPAQRFERLYLGDPRSPREYPVRIRILELGRERRVIGGRWRNHLLIDRRHAHGLRLLLGIVDFPARDRDRHGGKSDAHRLFCRRLDKGERRAAVVAAGVRGGAEL